MTQIKKQAIFATSAVLLILGTIPAFAALVPCTNNCTLCDLFVLIKNIINWLIEISVVLGSAFFAWGAIDIMRAGDSETILKEGKDRIKTAVIGIVIVATAWLLVGTILQFVTGSQSKLPWNEIQCSVPKSNNSGGGNSGGATGSW